MLVFILLAVGSLMVPLLLERRIHPQTSLLRAYERQAKEALDVASTGVSLALSALAIAVVIFVILSLLSGIFTS